MEASPAWDIRLEKNFRSRVEKISPFLCYKHLPFFLQAKLDMMWKFWKKESDLHKKKRKKNYLPVLLKWKNETNIVKLCTLQFYPIFMLTKSKKQKLCRTFYLAPILSTIMYVTKIKSLDNLSPAPEKIIYRLSKFAFRYRQFFFKSIVFKKVKIHFFINFLDCF